DDVTQETFLRVLQLLRRQGGLERPDRLGSFVYSVCRRVLAEHLRKEQAGAPWPGDAAYHVLLDEALVRRERKRLVNEALQELSPIERQALRLVFLEERDRAEVCAELGLSPDYLRVVLCRGKSRLRRVLEGVERFTRAGPERAPASRPSETTTGSEITDQ
ncbi:MAG: RNA polymerase sigma factor, partial [Bryobacteraceae bacterium]